MADKRDIRRIKQRITIYFGLDEVSRVAFTEDISASGMFIKTPNIAPVNSIVKILLTLPDGSFVNVTGRVTWARKVPQNLFHLAKKCGMGIRFLCFLSGEEAFHAYIKKIATTRVIARGDIRV
ncbi:MAG: PilZ domain-containing protein [Desulfuromonadaceae bacterium]